LGWRRARTTVQLFTGLWIRLVMDALEESVG
jgi:hypothetical protein